MSNKALIIYEKMLAKDGFSKFLGVELLAISEGYCKLGMTVRSEMLNGFGIAHGGISYSLADSAFAFASNSRGKKAVSIETSINHVKSLQEGDFIIAEATEEAITKKTGVYRVIVTKDEVGVIAVFKGTVYRTDENWIDQ